jgi:hypothetical protein
MTRHTRHTNNRRTERGSILVQVAVSIVTLIGFSAIVVDYGVQWAGRHQAQNAADSGALAAAVSLAFGDPTDQATARAAGLATARSNRIWAATPDVTDADITFPACPPGAPGAADGCVRVDVFRNAREGGDPLPTFFGQLVGLTEQGVRATATAKVMTSSTADCVKPFSIPDRWQENLAPADQFNRYTKKGQLLSGPVDVYVPPSASSPGTGYHLPDDYGRQVTLKEGSPHDTAQPGWYYAVRLSPSDHGANDFRWNIANCNPAPVGPGTILDLENGNMAGPTAQGMADLIAQDPDAYWDPTANNGLGAPVGGCMAAGTCARSPRLALVSVFNPDTWAQGKTNGSSHITVTNVIGVWIECIQSGDVIGYLTYAPAPPSSTSSLNPSASFLRSVILVR